MLFSHDCDPHANRECHIFLPVNVGSASKHGVAPLHFAKVQWSAWCRYWVVTQQQVVQDFICHALYALHCRSNSSRAQQPDTTTQFCDVYSLCLCIMHTQPAATCRQVASEQGAYFFDLRCFLCGCSLIESAIARWKRGMLALMVVAGPAVGCERRSCLQMQCARRHSVDCA